MTWPFHAESRRGRWGRTLLAMAGCLAIGAGVLTQVNTPVRTPVGALGVGTGSHPVGGARGPRERRPRLRVTDEEAAI